MTIEDRLRNALAEHAAAVAPPPDRWDEVEARAARIRRRARLRTGGLGALGLVAAAVIALVAVPALRDEPSHRLVTTPAPGATSTTSPTAAGGPTTSKPAAKPPTVAFPYQPLWPFRSQDDAASWQQSFRNGGHQPWHLDADQTALSFTTGYLGFNEINRVVNHTVSGNQARVAVGYPTEGGRTGTAAVIHLVRYGSGTDAPWEVVGTDDTDLSVTAPAYGATVTSPVKVGGRITGVDESIKVQVRQSSTESPLGESCCLPAGGTNTPWQATVAFYGATDPVVTIVASTGGHLQAVERFAVTGARAS